MRKSDWFLLMLGITTLVAFTCMYLGIEGYNIIFIFLNWIWLGGEIYYMKKERKEYQSSLGSVKNVI